MVIFIDFHDMGRESIEESQLSNPLLLVKDRGGRSGAVDSNHDHDGDDGSSSATTMVVLSTLVAVSGSYVFGTAVSLSMCLIDQDSDVG